MHHYHHQSSSSPPPNPTISPTMSITPMGLARYGSAPGSFFSSLVSDHHHHHHDSSPSNHHQNTTENDTNITQDFNFLGRSRFFTTVGDTPCLTSESTCKVDSTDLNESKSVGLEMGLERSYVNINDIHVGGDLAISSRGGGEEAAGVVVGGRGVSSSPLFRHSSSPAGFLSNILTVDNGFSVTRGGAGYSSQSTSDAMHVMANRRLKSQLSFSSRQDSLSHLSEISSEDAATGNIGQYMASNFQIGSWEDSNQIAFSGLGSKRGKDNNGDIIAALNSIDPSAYSLTKNSLDMASVDNIFQIQQESVPCKIRAKRGCATHPRSIAERERRTRISEKLRKLQDLVPNMDKQTSTADMLDLAVQHIKGLQTQIQMMNKESASCTCSSKKAIS